jgi:hypothetical protein
MHFFELELFLWIVHLSHTVIFDLSLTPFLLFLSLAEDVKGGSYEQLRGLRFGLMVEKHQ